MVYFNVALHCHVCELTEFDSLTLLFHVPEGSIRLVGGTTDREGRVEVYHSQNWGTVCDDSWDINDANVVCQQLNYSRAISALGEAYFGEGSGPIHYDEVTCNGTETHLADCAHNGVGIHDCSHSEDAGVQCDVIPGQ